MVLTENGQFNKNSTLSSPALTTQNTNILYKLQAPCPALKDDILWSKVVKVKCYVTLETPNTLETRD